MAKRILIFSIGYYPYIGGSEVAIKEITDRISKKEAIFDMVTLRFTSQQPKEERMGNVLVYRVGSVDDSMQDVERLPFRTKIAKLLFPFSAFLKARKLHKEHPYDLIWVNMANHGAFAALFFKWCFPRVEYVLMLQNGQTVDQVMRKNTILRLIYPLYKKIYIKADRIQAISEFTRDLARDMGAKCPIELISNGVNVRHFSQPYSEEELDQIRREYTLSKEKTYLITTSRLVMHRGVEDVIRSLTHLPNSIEFLVLGAGSDRAKLEVLANDIDVRQRVHFLGQVDHGKLPKYLKVADIFVRPSLHEGFGNSFIEAMVAGLPVVATPVGGIPDFLYDPDANPDKKPTGLFCKVNDSKSIAVQVSRLLDDRELRERLVANAQRLATERYDWEQITDRMKKDVFKLTS